MMVNQQEASSGTERRNPAGARGLQDVGRNVSKCASRLVETACISSGVTRYPELRFPA